MSPDLFERAFNYLSETSLDGMPNPHYHRTKEYVRPTLDEHRQQKRPLCTGLLMHRFEGKWYPLGTRWTHVGKYQFYSYIARARDRFRAPMWHQQAASVDETIVQMLHDKLNATFDPEQWETRLATFQRDYSKERSRLSSQLEHLATVRENLIGSLDTLTHPEMRRAVQARYEAAEVEEKRLQQALQEESREARQLEAITMLRHSCRPALEHWKDLTRPAKRELIQIFVQRVEVDRLRVGVLRLTIYWCDGEVNIVECVTRSISGRVRRGWLASEEEQLVAAIDRGATAIEIAALFPYRTWNAIDVKARTLRPGSLKFGQRLIRPTETLNDYTTRTGDLVVAPSGATADTKAV